MANRNLMVFTETTCQRKQYLTPPALVLSNVFYVLIKLRVEVLTIKNWFFKNDWIDFLKRDLQTWNFAHGVWSGCPAHSYQKNLKIFRLRKTWIFNILKMYSHNLTKVYSKAGFHSNSESWKISRGTSGLDKVPEDQILWIAIWGLPTKYLVKLSKEHF